MNARTSWGDGPGAIAPDGCSVEVYRRLRPGREIGIVRSVVPFGSTILELGCGAGRMTHALIDDGYRLTAVDESPEMLACVRGAEIVHARIGELDLGRRFDAVLLASTLLNTPDLAERSALLRCCGRHLDDRGVALFEVHQPTRVAAARAGPIDDVDGVRLSLREIVHEGRFFRATIVHAWGGATWTQTFRAELLEQSDLEMPLREHGLKFDRWLDDANTWFSARRSALVPP